MPKIRMKAMILTMTKGTPVSAKIIFYYAPLQFFHILPY